MKLTSKVEARVDKVMARRVRDEVRKRRETGAAVSDADILREALAEYFKSRELKAAA